MNAPPELIHRILLVDDSPAIHQDFRKILIDPLANALSEDEAELFGESCSPAVATGPTLQIDSAHQGAEALALVQRAQAEGHPYAMAFMDVRMPPGWDGIETTARIWGVDPDLQVVVCTAYSDYSREEMLEKLGRSDRLLILKKPFDTVEVLQLVTALTEKWRLTRQVRQHVQELEQTVSHRTEQLRSSEDRYRLITENAADLVGLVTPEARWLYRSPSFQRLLGHTAEELSNLSLLDLIAPEDQANVTASLHECLQRDVRLTCEFRIRPCNGAWATMEAHVSPFRNARGAVEGILVVTRDITERRKLELQLRQAQKLESIGQLAAGIAHEINTPLQFIGDNLRFLDDSFRDLDPVLQMCIDLVAVAENGAIPSALLASARATLAAASPDYLRAEIPKATRDTLAGVQRTSKIVQAMKTFSHPGSTEKILVDLREAIESTLTVSHSEWREVAEVVTEFDPELPAVPLLAAEFNQALLNLIVNASHAIADAIAADPARGKGVLTVTTRHSGDFAEVRIRDNGTGIPVHVQDRIFDPFFTTKPMGKGTGQGLPIARSVVVEQHGGTLEFETTPGCGTVFFIRVPLLAAEPLVAPELALRAS
jgi:PAS domain S-box-containing protein